MIICAECNKEEGIYYIEMASLKRYCSSCSFKLTSGACKN